MKKYKSFIYAFALFACVSCSSNKEKETINSVDNTPIVEPVSFITNEDLSRNFLKSKIFYGNTYRIEIDAEGKLKVFNNSDGNIFFESTPGHQFDIGELKNDGRWISIRGGEWMIQPINGQIGQLDTKFEFVLLKDETLLLTKTGEKYSLVEETIEPNNIEEESTK